MRENLDWEVDDFPVNWSKYLDRGEEKPEHFGRRQNPNIPDNDERNENSDRAHFSPALPKYRWAYSSRAALSISVILIFLKWNLKSVRDLWPTVILKGKNWVFFGALSHKASTARYFITSFLISKKKKVNFLSFWEEYWFDLATRYEISLLLF